MKNIFSTRFSEQQGDVAMLILRIGAGAMMITHGWPKLQTLMGDEPIQFMEFLGLSATVSLALTVFAEFFCSILVVFGLATRLAVIPLIITMLVAVFYVHADDPFQRQEMGLLYLTTYLVLLFMGSGRFSLDAAIFRNQKSEE